MSERVGAYLQQDRELVGHRHVYDKNGEYLGVLKMWAHQSWAFHKAVPQDSRRPTATFGVSFTDRIAVTYRSPTHFIEEFRAGRVLND